MTTLNFDESIKKFVLEQFSNISKRYESYDPRTRSLMFLDKLHLALAVISSAYLTDEASSRINQNRCHCSGQCNCSEERQDRIKSAELRCQHLRNAFDVVKKELDAIEKYIQTASPSSQSSQSS